MIELAGQEKLPYEQAYKRKHLPKKTVMKQKTGTFLQIKWRDSPDTVVMLIHKPTECVGEASLQVIEPKRGHRLWVNSSQVVAVLGQVIYPEPDAQVSARRD